MTVYILRFTFRHMIINAKHSESIKMANNCTYLVLLLIIKKINLNISYKSEKNYDNNIHFGWKMKASAISSRNFCGLNWVGTYTLVTLFSSIHVLKIYTCTHLYSCSRDRICCMPRYACVRVKTPKMYPSREKWVCRSIYMQWAYISETTTNTTTAKSKCNRIHAQRTASLRMHCSFIHNTAYPKHSVQIK